MTLHPRAGIGATAFLLLTTTLTPPALAQDAGPPSGGGGGGGGGGSSLSSGVTDDTEELLAGIDSLPQSTMDANLAVTIEVNNSADAERVALAQADAEHGSSPIVSILGDTIESYFDSSGAYATLVSAVASLTSSDASYAKSYFSTTNAYGTAYDSDSSTGNPRPFVVSDEIIQYGSSSGSSYPSGHSTSGYTYSLLLAIAFPEAYQELLYRGAEYAESRVVLGVHYALDTIAARILAMKDIVNLLANDPDYLESADLTEFYAAYLAAIEDLRDTIETETGSTISEILESELDSDYTADETQEERYTYLLTYGLTNGESTDEDPVVPENAELLIATRFPYLTTEQLREVLATTELPSGVALDDGTGWARLNLYAAANGYGSFDSDVTVYMDADEGGYSASDTWSNDIDGEGGLIKQGTGTLALTGDNTFSGGITVEGGTLVVDSGSTGTGDIVDDATLAFDQDDDGETTNTLSGSGDLLKYGTGTLTYSGDGSGFTGTTSVLEGRLAVNGDLSNSEIGIADGAELGGSGTVGSTYAAEGATIAPGNSIGTLTVSGDLYMASGSIYEVEVDADGNSDLLVVTGTATIEGAVVEVDADDGDYDWKTDYTILTAAGGISGTFASVSTNFAYLDGALSYSYDSVTLTLTRNDLSFADAVETANQKAVAAAIEALGETNAVYDAIMTASEAEVSDAFESLSGDFHAGLESVLTVQLLDFGAALRAHDLQGGRGAWVSIFGRETTLDADSTMAGIDSDHTGLIFGFDLRSDGGWRLGVSGEAGSGDATGATGESADIDSYGIGAIASKSFGATELRLGATLGRYALDTTRRVTANSLEESLEASYDATSALIFAELSREVATEGGTLSPYAGISHAHLSLDGFSETGGDAALSAEADSLDASFVEIGLRMHHRLTLGAAPATLYGALAWQGGFGLGAPTRELALAGSPFTVAGQPLAETAVKLDLGVSVAFAENATLSAAYAGQFGTGFKANAVKLNATWRF